MFSVPVCSSQEQKKRYKRRSCGSVFIVCSPCPCAPRRSRRGDIKEEAGVLCLSCVLRVRVLLAGAEGEI